MWQLHNQEHPHPQRPTLPFTISHFPCARPWGQVAGPQGTSSGTALRASSPEQNPTMALSLLRGAAVLYCQPTSAQVQQGYYINFYIIKRGSRSHRFFAESSLQVANMGAFERNITSLHTPEAAQHWGLGDTDKFLISVLAAEFLLGLKWIVIIKKEHWVWGGPGRWNQSWTYWASPCDLSASCYRHNSWF